jgi:hypothetical protein
VSSGLRLLPVFIRRDNARNDIGSLGLTAAGVGVATALALTVLSFLPGFGGRADRMAWREPTPVASVEDATAAQMRSTDLFDNHAIDRVDLAPVGDTPSADLPVPPGLDAFPAPGEIYVSPALQRLLEDTPSDELADRFPGRVVGTIGDAGVAHENELVAVIGHEAGDLGPLAPRSEVRDEVDRFPGDPSPVAGIAGFATSGSNELMTGYSQAIAVVAVLLTVPAILLVGSAARLTAARRNQRLAALRLVGATPGTVVVLTAAETALAAFGGAVAGLALYAILLPVIAMFPLAGGPWSAADLWIGLGPALLTLVLVPAMAAVSATIALRQVSVSPLGVAQRVSGRRPRAIRLLGMVGAWILLLVGALSFRGGSAGILLLLLGMGAVIGSLSLVGPWIAWLLGKVLLLVSRRPPTLLAARRIIDDPKAAFRSVSGIVLAGFIAGLLFAVGPSVDAVDPGFEDTHGLEVFVEDHPELAASVEAQAQERLAAAGLEADVEVERSDSEGPALGDEGWNLRVVPADVDDTERVRTSLAGLVPNHTLVGDGEDIYGNATAFGDVRRMTLMLLLIALVMAGTATAIGSAASVLDQRETLSRLRLAGTPVATLQRARVWHAAVPLIAATVASLASGMATAYMLLFAGGADGEQLQAPDMASITAMLVCGLVIGIGSAAVTRPLLVSSTAYAE